ncbi:MAG: metallophosphoesterase [Roseburia sp.]
MRTAVISDIHLDDNTGYDVEGALRVFLLKNEIELLLLAGDIETDYEKTIAFIERLEDSSNTLIRYVPGNHDLWNLYHQNETTDEVYAHFLNDSRCLSAGPFLIGDYAIIGDVGWYDYTYGDNQIPLSEYEKMQRNGRVWQDSIRNQWTRDNIGKNEYFIQKLREQLECYRDKKKILVTHMISNSDLCVKRKCGDWNYFNGFLGSIELEKLIYEYQVEYAVCGHVHFRRNVERKGTTWFCRCLSYEEEWRGNKDIYRQIEDAIYVFEL